MKRLLPKLMSFTDAELRLGETMVLSGQLETFNSPNRVFASLDPSLTTGDFERRHCLELGRFLADQLSLHFAGQLRAQALRIFGSVDFLGNPLGLMSDLSSGMSDLADMDISGMVRNVAHGVGDSTAKVRFHAGRTTTGAPYRWEPSGFFRQLI